MSEYVDPHIQGWMNAPSLEWLYANAADKKVIVEIGCWLGKSTHALLSGCKDGLVYAVDHFKGSPGEPAHKEAATRDMSIEFFKNVGHFQNLCMLKMDSIEASKLFADKSVDMVFVDGAHDYQSVLADLKAWMPKCNWLLCGHDHSQDGVPQALKDCGIKYRLEAENSLWVYAVHTHIEREPLENTD